MKIIITESQYQVLIENTVEINQILDKIGKFGYENLENDEKLTLNQYSEWLKTGKSGEFTPKFVDFESKNNDFKGKIGEEYSTYLPDGSEFSFKYDYSEILDKENIYYGVVKWHGEEWIGLFATNKSGKLTEIDFIKDYDALQSYDLDDEMGGYDEGREVRLQNELKKDIHQVKYFFENEVVINLNDL